MTAEVWSKIRLFTLIRVLLMNLQYLVLSVLATVWIAGSPCTGYAFLFLLFLRGLLLRSWPAAVVALLAVTHLGRTCMTAGSLGFASQPDVYELLDLVQKID